MVGDFTWDWIFGTLGIIFITAFLLSAFGLVKWALSWLFEGLAWVIEQLFYKEK